MPRIYVSITGLLVKSFSAYPRFYYHALPTLKQAMQAPGNISTTVTTYKGIQFTMTAWENREYMLQYLHTGAHLEAMKAVLAVGSYVKVFSYWLDLDKDTIPNWSHARRLWERNGRVVIGKPCKAFGDVVAITEQAESEQKESKMTTLFYFVTDVAMIPVVLLLGLLLLAAVIALLFGLSPIFVAYN